MAASLFFIGNGHTGEAAFRSLRRAFPEIEVVSGNPQVLDLARPSDCVKKSVEAITAPVGLMAGYRGILDPSFLSNRTVLNVHYSLLPQYRGLHSVIWAILNLEDKVGWTVHVVNEFVDDGPIVHQRETKYNGETSWEIIERFNNEVEDSLADIVCQFISGRIQPVPQEKSEASWVPHRNLDDCLIDFDWPSRYLRALFRALVHPYPLPSILANGGRYEIPSAKIVERNYFCDSGRVVNIDNEGVWIKCKDSLLVIKRLIDEDGNDIEPSKVLRVGERLSQDIS